MNIRAKNLYTFNKYVKKFNKYSYRNMFGYFCLHELAIIDYYVKNGKEYVLNVLRENPFMMPWTLEKCINFVLCNKALSNRKVEFSQDTFKDINEIVTDFIMKEDVLKSKNGITAFDILPAIMMEQANFLMEYDALLYRLYKIFTFENEKINMRELFEKKFGYSYDKYLFFVALLYSELFLFRKNYNEYSKITDLVGQNQELVKHLIIEHLEFKKTQLNIYDKLNYNFYYSPKLINSKPIIKIDEVIWVPLPLSLMNALYVNVYNEFSYNNNYNREALGKAFEAYCYEIAKKSFKNYDVSPEVVYSGNKSSDVIISNRIDSVCFVECKIKECNLGFFDLADDNNKEKMIKSICDAIHQVARNFYDFESKIKIKLPFDTNAINKYGIIMYLKSSFITKSEIFDFYFNNLDKYNNYGYDKDFLKRHISISDINAFERITITETPLFDCLENVEPDLWDTLSSIKNKKTNKCQWYKNELDAIMDICKKLVIG